MCEGTVNKSQVASSSNDTMCEGTISSPIVKTKGLIDGRSNDTMYEGTSSPKAETPNSSNDTMYEGTIQKSTSCSL